MIKTREPHRTNKCLLASVGYNLIDVEFVVRKYCACQIYDRWCWYKMISRSRISQYHLDRVCESNCEST